MEKGNNKRDKKKILLVMPLVIFPLLALCFKVLGGGSVENAGQQERLSGINAVLPDADFKVEDPADKMAFYARAGKDTVAGDRLSEAAGRLGFTGRLDRGQEQTVQIEQKLAALDREMNAPREVASSGGSGVKRGNMPNPGMKNEVDRLEQMMRSMQQDRQGDPEMEQMNGMLEKLLDIQQPGRAQQKVVASIYGGEVSREFLAVPAELASGGKVLQGATVKLRLLDSVRLKEVWIPKGHLVYGLCRLVNQRLLLEIKHVRLGNAIIPVELTMYGMDGMPGLSAPDAVFSEAVGSGAVDAAGGISVYGMEGIAGQVAGAGVDAARSLFRRRVKAVKVKLRTGEKVLLRVGRN